MSRRIAQVPIALQFIEEALLPPGSSIRAADFNFVRLTVDFVVESPDLEEVDPGAMPPVLTPLVTTESVVVSRDISWD